MRRQKKNIGCLGALIYLILLMMAFSVVVALSFYGIIIVGIIFLSIYFFKFIIFAVKKTFFYLRRMYDERMQSGEPTFIRKFFDILNMDNWKKKSNLENDDSIEVESEAIPINEVETFTEEVVESDIEEHVRESELEIVTIEENNENIYTENKAVIESQEAVKGNTKPVKREPKPKRRYMSQYDIEQFAKECNAYVVREERKERQESEWREREEEQKDD